MQSTIDLLQQRATELEKEFRFIKRQLEDTRKALKAIVPSSTSGQQKHRSSPKNPMTVRQAIIEAIKSERVMPTEIFDFMSKQLGMSTSKNSINTQLNRMKKAGLVAHNGKHWTLPTAPSVQKNSPPDAATSGGLNSVEERDPRQIQTQC